MYDQDSKGLSYTAGFFMLIAFAVAALLAAAVISIPVWTGMTGIPFSQMDEQLKNPQYGHVTKILHVINAVIGFFLPAVIVAYMLNHKPLNLLGFAPRIKIGQVALVILLMVGALIVATSLSYVTEQIPISAFWREVFDKMEEQYVEMASAIITLDSPGEFLLALLIMGFVPALCEETLFRGGLQNFLTRATRMPWVSILIVSFIFSAVHFSFYGFLSRFFLGIILGLIYQYSGSLWLSILAHFVNNAAAVVVMYVLKMQGKSIEEAMAENSESYWGFAALPVVIGLLVLFRRISYGSALLKKQASR